jgi:4-carboxymuconolactone decarboxylase
MTERQARFPTLSRDQMTATQRKVVDEILSSPRGSIGGPMQPWLRSPELALLLQQVGQYNRFSSSAPKRLHELAILLTARHHDCEFVWFAHYDLALAAGLAPAVADDINDGRRPATLKPDETVVFDFCGELREQGRVSDPTFAAAKSLLGDQGVIDLTVALGFYSLIAITLAVAETGAPPDAKVKLKPLQR